MTLRAALIASLLLLFSGCSKEKEAARKTEVAFSVLVPKPVAKQRTGFVEGIRVFTSSLPRSRVSAMVVNNPIRADREAVIALAIENLGEKSIHLDWNAIVFFHPKNVIRMLPPEKVCDYFEEPGHSKPVLGSHLFLEALKKAGAVGGPGSRESNLTATEKSLGRIYRNIRKDLCFVQLPRNANLEPGSIVTGFLVIVLPKEHFVRSTQFMLKIPVDGDLHKLRYTLLPIR